MLGGNQLLTIFEDNGHQLRGGQKSRLVQRMTESDAALMLGGDLLVTSLEVSSLSLRRAVGNEIRHCTGTVQEAAFALMA